MNRIVILLLILFFYQSAVSQKVERAAIQQVGDDLIFSFDLMPKESIKERYTISLLALYESDTVILKLKEGSLTEVGSGKGLQFVVSGRDHLGDIKGHVDFNVHAKMTYSPIRILSPAEGQSVKIGKDFMINWQGGVIADDYNISLYQSDSLILELIPKTKGNDFTWQVPQQIKRSDNYQIHLTSNNHPNQPEISSEFKIRKNLPIAVKILPLAVLGGVTAYLLSTTPDEVTVVPDPPLLPSF